MDENVRYIEEKIPILTDMDTGVYYNPTTLLSKRDLNGNVPEIFICQGNRTGGKTTNVVHWLIECQLRGYFRKVGFLYRYTNELEGAVDSLFKDVIPLFYPDSNVYAKRAAGEKFPTVYFDDKPIGYLLSLNGSEYVKKRSNLYSEIDCYIMDEFQSESDDYLSKELIKFSSVHASIARGRNQLSRYVPVILLSNSIHSLNPYYAALGISDRIRSDTKFMRGTGWVFENNFNAAAAEAQKSSLFNQAFSGVGYIQSMTSNGFLYDNNAFIEKLDGASRYLATIKYDDALFSLKEYPDKGFVYVDTHADGSFPIRLSASSSSHSPGFVLSTKSNPLIKTLRDYYDYGLVRFKNQRCKSALVALLTR